MAALQAGSQIGSYVILAPLGAGGMGEVYRSRDTKLKREVAIKVLPAEFLHDPERLRRFRREAELLATLNHPHVAQIYGIEEIPSTGSGHADEAFCLVLELVEGETLGDRLAHGAIPVDESLEIARQIAEALEAAHGQGIVHRDLKPANIKITPTGRVKVLDFGLAKPIGPDAPAMDISQSPTLASATIPGVILGTAAYMSPEQAKARAADARSDIWAFGCVLYEMLAGRPVFTGDSVVEILGAVLKSEPDWQALPQETPLAVLSLLKRCLQKDRNRRMRDVADARFQIEEATTSEPASRATSTAPPRRGRERLAWIAVTFALASVAALSIGYPRGAPSVPPEMRLEIVTPPGADVSGFAISPNGRTLVFQATVDGKNQLWLRPLDSETARPLAGTEGGSFPFWSPNNDSVAFFAGGQLKRIDVATGFVQNLAEAPLNTRGGSWNAAGTILFTRSSTEPLFRVPASGGKAVAATEVTAPHLGHRYPQFLPDGQHFLFFAFGPPESQGIYAGSLDSMKATRLLDAESAPIFAPPNYVLFARQGAVLAQQVDLDTLQTVGDPLPVARQVATPQGTVGGVALSAAAAGPIAYRADGGDRQMRWVDRAGRQIAVLGGPDPGEPTTVRLSPTAARSRSIGWSTGTATYGCSRPRVMCGSDSRRIRRGNSIRSGLPTAAASFLARLARVSSTFTSDRLAVRRPRRWCGSPLRARTDSTGRWTASGSSLRCRVPEQPAISGRCRLRARGRRSPWRPPRQTNRSRDFLPTAVGLPINRTRADGTKSTFNAFPNPAAGRRSRPTAPRFPSGSVTESRCSIWTPATALRAWPCCRRARA